MPFNQYVEMGAFEYGLEIDEVVVKHLGEAAYLLIEVAAKFVRDHLLLRRRRSSRVGRNRRGS